MSIVSTLSLLVLLLACTACAETPPQSTPGIAVRDVATGLNTPWEILWGPDGHIWYTERRGVVGRVDPQTGTRKVLLTIDAVEQDGESGLMGMALHPDFDTSPFVYLAYTYRSSGGMALRIARYTYGNATLSAPHTILDDIAGYVIHDGCRLAFAPDGTLFLTTGDAGTSGRAQNSNSLNGKILRIHADGSIPADNPLPGSPVWATGIRNAQGLVFAPDGTLYISDHGPASDDELNRITKGANYGWPTVKGFCNTAEEQEFCREHRVVEPIVAWTPTLAVCGLDYYAHSALGDWNNSLLIVCLKGRRLLRINPETGEQQEYFANAFGRLRDLCIAPDGRVFLATSNRDGRGSPAAADDRIIELSAQQ